MSLVREALEKAEREAAAHAARERGLPPKITATGQPYRARRQRSPLLPLLAGAAAVAIAAGLFWWRGSSESRLSSDPAAKVSTAAEIGPGTATPEPGSLSVAEPAAAPAPGATPIAPPPTTATTAAKPPTSATADPAPNPSLESDAQTAAPTPGRRPPPTKKETYTRETTLENGTTIHLGGIAWSDAAPLAYLNGKLLAVGETVAGCRVEKIDRDRVELAHGERRLVLTLR